MTPDQVRAIGILLGEALIAGVRFSEIMDEVEKHGEVTEDMWQDIRADVERAEERWRNAGQ